ncbi:peptidylprolyl isomerase [Pseudomonas sp. UL073]|uniref:peptidylprolyl isomerase n=1 Tax=Zestomonas insulae TaxID=2809017 RepID=A0ABS2I895_9GAMM|nr:peptidylprolyl isomerase [Pseudomonas insulae]MBM7059200.1 peptidylprolyl isomerase [Pseudomonas insulae]
MNRLAVAALLSLSLLAPALHAEEVGVAARVNEAEISNYRLDRYFADFLKAKSRSVASIRNPSSYKRLKREALNELIDKELLWQEAHRQGVAVDDEQVRRELSAVKAAFSTPEAYQRQLVESGFDEGAYAEYLRRELVAQRMLNTLVQPLTVSDDEVRRGYQERRASFARPEQVRARHILLRVPAGASDEQVETVARRIKKLRRQLVAGTDFAELARAQSEDPSGARGGELGYFSRGQMVPAFEAAAFALDPGEVSEPVRSEFGWHLIQVEEYVAEGQLDEAMAMATVRDQLLYQRYVLARDAALNRLRSGSRIEVARGL